MNVLVFLVLFPQNSDLESKKYIPELNKELLVLSEENCFAIVIS